MRASNMVRDPAVAPPYKDTASTPSCTASYMARGVISVDRAKLVLILRNMSSNNTPDVPPILADTASAMVANNGTGCVTSKSLLPSSSRRFKISVAPRFMVIPQSPSPTIVSYFVNMGSASDKACAAERIISDTILLHSYPGILILGSSILFDACPLFTTTSGTSVNDGRLLLPLTFQISQALQDRASVSASNQTCNSEGAEDKFKMEILAPCILKDVMYDPTITRVTVHL
mmetsp:Transcript_12594/g.17871  ORF Transcript_12594/g.17871 Transcript_12594/m.17871 type:complete len:231 (-) Transcript_12594:378-1070(-)